MGRRPGNSALGIPSIRPEIAVSMARRRLIAGAGRRRRGRLFGADRNLCRQRTKALDHGMATAGQVIVRRPHDPL